MDRNAPPAPKPPSAKPASTSADLPEVSTGGWIVSSFDLLRGAEVDTSGDTVPDELFDELFAPEQRKPTGTEGA